jgi:hypothetical protein
MAIIMGVFCCVYLVTNTARCSSHHDDYAQIGAEVTLKNHSLKVIFAERQKYKNVFPLLTNVFLSEKIIR